MNVYLDIETIPDQSKDAIEKIAKTLTIKCPHSTKDQIGKDLRMPAEDIKFTSKADLEARWLKEFSKKHAAVQAEESWRKTSFDGGAGEIISIAWAVGDSSVSTVSRSLDDSESELIRRFHSQVIEDLNGRPPFFIGHNIKFDLKFLFRRCIILGVAAPHPYAFNGRHEKDYFDNSQAWCEFKEYISQDNLAKILGLKGKSDEIDGSKVWDFVKAGKVNDVALYNADDVIQLRQIYKKLTFSEWG